jgi:dihydroxyacetone kinase-like protein
MNLSRDRFVDMMASGLKAVEARKDELSALDGATGDGDHGIAICEALGAAVQAAKPESDFKTLLTEMAFATMTGSSGSTSTLIGAWLLGMADAAAKDELTPQETAVMFASGLSNVRQQTKADVGDKTIMDALIPASEALQSHQDEGLGAMFAKAAEAADTGRARTADLVAKFGRARNLGDRVIGHVDAGATSMTIIFKAFADSLAE